MRSRWKRAAALLAAMALGACTTAPPRYYVLEPVSPPREATAGGARVLLDPVSIPAEVDRAQMLLSLPGGEVKIDDAHRWAAPLALDIAEVLARDLASALGAERVTTDPGPGPWTSRRVRVGIVAFESRPGIDARIEAWWEVREGNAVTRGTARVSEPAPGGFTELSAAHSRALSAIAARIAADLERSGATP